MADAMPEAALVPGTPPRLRAGRCPGCGHHHFPATTDCPYCGAPGAEEVALEGAGRLWAWTAVTSAPPGYLGPVPYGFGVVELPEGLRVVGRLTESDPAALSEGQAMVLVTEELPTADGGALTVWAFAPAGGAGR